jgi:carboxypeptidase family protein
MRTIMALRRITTLLVLVMLLTFVVGSADVCWAAPDTYEDDDTFSQANVIVLNNDTAQNHNFDKEGDEDWVKFYGVAGETYEIKTDNLESNCDTEIWLYNESGTTVAPKKDDYGYEHGELLSWPCPSDGMYYVMVKQYSASDYGDNTGYDLKVYRPVGEIFGFVAGTITDKGNGQPIEDVRIKTDENWSSLSLLNGTYLMIHPAGTVTMTVEADGYKSVTCEVTVPEAGLDEWDIELEGESTRPNAMNWIPLLLLN